MIADRDIPRDIEVGYTAALMGAVGGRVEPKRGSALMSAAGAALRVLGIGLGDRWDTTVITTVGTTIYVPWAPAAPEGPWSPWDRMAVLAHEAQHIHQHARDGALSHATRFLASRPERVAIEAEAYTTSIELHWWRYGELPRWLLDRSAELLRGYGVGQHDVEHARAHLLAIAPTVRRGGLLTYAGRIAVGWLDEHAPELRHPLVPSRRPS